MKVEVAKEVAMKVAGGGAEVEREEEMVVVAAEVEDRVTATAAMEREAKRAKGEVASQMK